MKRIYLVIMASLVLLQGCDKFLDLKPQDIQVVSTVEDYRDLLASYMRLLKTTNRSQLPVLGGTFLYPKFDVANTFAYRTGELSYSKVSSEYYDATLGEYTTKGVKMLTWLQEDDELWERYYSFLGPINMIIDGIETVECTDEDTKNFVKGEALVWRAFAYFKLLQYYSPYDDNQYGIPVFLKPYDDPGNAMPERKTQVEVYEQILSDCEEALRLLEITPTNSWNCAYHPRFIYGMLASIYSYKAMSAASAEDDWEQAIACADEAMSGCSFVRDQATYNGIFDCTAQTVFKNDEFFLRLVDGTNGQIANFANTYYQTSPGWGPADEGPSMDFYALYHEDDVRKQAFFREQMDGSIIFDKYNISANPMAFLGAGGIIMPFRLAETALIKAEALCRLGREAEAKDVLDDFKSGRYLDVEASYTESELLDEILKERKLEFYHEQDMWWLDMKRLGSRVERVINGSVYVLEPDDFRYALPIPQDEMLVNKNMIQNPGWDEITF